MSSTVPPPVDGQAVLAVHTDGQGGPSAALAQAAGSIDGAQTLWAARSGAELTAAVEGIAALRAKLDALELAVVAELDASPAGQASLKNAGWASVKDYVTHTTGGRRGAGPAALRLARRLEEYPSLAAALAAGTVSRTKVDIIVAAVEKLPADPVLREKATAVLLEEAGRLSADDLERAGRRVLEVVDPDGVEAAAERDAERTERSAHLNRRFHLGMDGLGGGSGRLHGPKEDLLLLTTVLLAPAKPQPAEPGGAGVCADLACKANGHSGRDLREHGTRMFDALIQLARAAQAAGLTPDSHGGVPQLVVTMAYDDLAHALHDATTTLGEDLDPATARRMACDADLVPAVLGSDSALLDVGRTQRLVTAAVWVALVVRDQHCAFPGCRRPPVMCHAHHIRHWVDGGPTCLDNLVLLCGTHHRILHSTPWEVRLDPRDRRPAFRPPGSDTWVRDRGGTDPPSRARALVGSATAHLRSKGQSTDLMTDAHRLVDRVDRP